MRCVNPAGLNRNRVNTAVKHPGWNKIFDEGDRIRLTPQALVPCVAELQKYRFFGSDLDVLDAAFEHLVNPEQKGDKDHTSRRATWCACA